MSEPEINEAIFPLGAWEPSVHAALTALIQSRGVLSPDYDPEEPPLAVIDCDEILINNDLGEAMLRFMVTGRRFKVDRGLWFAVPEKLGREAIVAAYHSIAGRTDNDVYEMAAFRRYRAGLLGAYETLRQTQPAAAYLFALRMLRGLHEHTVADLVEEILDYELRVEPTHEEIPAGPPFQSLVVPVGLRTHREVLQLLNALTTHGFQTWLVSNSNQYILKALAQRLGFNESHVLGMSLTTQGSAYTDRLEESWNLTTGELAEDERESGLPLDPAGEAKLEIFLDTVGRSPDLVIGTSVSDVALLENCEGLSILLGRDLEEGEEPNELEAYALKQGWLIQTQPFSANLDTPVPQPVQPEFEDHPEEY